MCCYLPPELICNKTEMTLVLPVGSLSKINLTELQLNSPACPITFNDTHLTARIALNGCGTKTVVKECSDSLLGGFLNFLFYVPSQKHPPPLLFSSMLAKSWSTLTPWKVCVLSPWSAVSHLSSSRWPAASQQSKPETPISSSPCPRQPLIMLMFG